MTADILTMGRIEEIYEQALGHPRFARARQTIDGHVTVEIGATYPTQADFAPGTPEGRVRFRAEMDAINLAEFLENMSKDIMRRVQQGRRGLHD